MLTDLRDRRARDADAAVAERLAICQFDDDGIIALPYASAASSKSTLFQIDMSHKTIRLFHSPASPNLPPFQFIRTILIVFLSYSSMSFLTRILRSFTSSSMSSAPAQPMSVPAGAQTATVAAGCFWGVEHMFRRQFKNKGLYDARVGYIGGDSQNPGYRAVCSGRTGRE